MEDTICEQLKKTWCRIRTNWNVTIIVILSQDIHRHRSMDYRTSTWWGLKAKVIPSAGSLFIQNNRKLSGADRLRHGRFSNRRQDRRKTSISTKEKTLRRKKGVARSYWRSDYFFNYSFLTTDSVTIQTILGITGITPEKSSGLQNSLIMFLGLFRFRWGRFFSYLNSS